MCPPANVSFSSSLLASSDPGDLEARGDPLAWMVEGFRQALIPVLGRLQLELKPLPDLDAVRRMKARFRYVGIRVKDLDRSIQFYTKLLGMRLRDRFKIKETKGEIANLVSKNKPFTLELNYYAKNSPHSTRYVVGEGLDHLAFEVEDLDKALEEARLAGYPTILEVNTKKSRWAYVKDPNGIWIELL